MHLPNRGREPVADMLSRAAGIAQQQADNADAALDALNRADREQVGMRLYLLHCELDSLAAALRDQAVRRQRRKAS